MPSFGWSCRACERTNPAFAYFCGQCECPKEATVPVSDAFRSRYLVRATGSLGNNESATQIQQQCQRCGHDYDQFMMNCKNCQTQFWCRWQASWYANPCTRYSMGWSARARSAGTIFVALTLAFVLYASAVFLSPGSGHPQWGRLLFFVVVMTYSAYEVWAFTHGRRTSIDHWTYDGTPSNTNMRVYGLVLDIVFWFGAIYFIVLASDA